MLDRMKKGIGLVVTLLVLMATLAVPVVSAQSVQQAVENDSANVAVPQGCGLCSQSAGGCSEGQVNDSNVTVEGREITGEEKNKNIAQAFSDKGVQGLRKELVKMGFKPSVENISVIETKTTNESGTITSLIVAMPYNGKDKNDSAVITFVSNELGTAAVAAVISNGMLSVVNYDAVTEGTVTIMSLECDLCQWLAMELCRIGTGAGCNWGCAYLCARVPNPLWIAICYVVCWPICRYVVGYGCVGTGFEMCQGAGLCP